MKKILLGAITLILLLGATYLGSQKFNGSMLDWAFFVGLSFSVIIYFFSSKGGYMAQQTNLIVQVMSREKQEYEGRDFDPSIPFLVSVIFTIVSFISMIVYYWDQF